MRHYEIMFLVHPDQTEQVPGMIEKFESIVKNQAGHIHRKEDLGRKEKWMQLNILILLQIMDYVLMNIECNNEALNELKTSFKFNDAIIRDLIIKQNKAITGESAMMKKESRSDDKR